MRQSLKQRHITMIALGGVIGAGCSSAPAPSSRPPAPRRSCRTLIGGVIVTLVMFMLGEMASRNPDSGSFSTYASSYLGEWAGFAVGWLYWFVDDDDHRRGDPARRDPSTISAVAARGGALFMLVTLIASNAYSVRSFGEAEYWLSFAKVTTIIIFMALRRIDPARLPAAHSRAGAREPHGSRRLHAERHLAGARRRDGRDLLARRQRNRGRCGGRIREPEQERDPRDQERDRARDGVLRRLGVDPDPSMPWTDKANLKSPYVSFNMAGFTGAAVAMKIAVRVVRR